MAETISRHTGYTQIYHEIQGEEYLCSHELFPAPPTRGGKTEHDTNTTRLSDTETASLSLQDRGKDCVNPTFPKPQLGGTPLAMLLDTKWVGYGLSTLTRN